MSFTERRCFWMGLRPKGNLFIFVYIRDHLILRLVGFITPFTGGPAVCYRVQMVYSLDSIKHTVHLTFHRLFFLLKVLFSWKIENSTFNRDSTKFISLENFQCMVSLTETKYLLQYVFEFKKFVLNGKVLINKQ